MIEIRATYFEQKAKHSHIIEALYMPTHPQELSLKYINATLERVRDTNTKTKPPRIHTSLGLVCQKSPRDLNRHWGKGKLLFWSPRMTPNIAPRMFCHEQQPFQVSTSCHLFSGGFLNEQPPNETEYCKL